MTNIIGEKPENASRGLNHPIFQAFVFTNNDRPAKFLAQEQV